MPNSTTLISEGNILQVDWIMHNGKAWLVPEWLLSPDGKQMQPAHMISVKMAQGYEMELGELPLQAFRQLPVSKSLLEQGIVPDDQAKLIEVIRKPDIWLPNPDHSH